MSNKDYRPPVGLYRPKYQVFDPEVYNVKIGP